MRELSNRNEEIRFDDSPTPNARQWCIRMALVEMKADVNLTYRKPPTGRLTGTLPTVPTTSSCRIKEVENLRSPVREAVGSGSGGMARDDDRVRK